VSHGRPSYGDYRSLIFDAHWSMVLGLDFRTCVWVCGERYLSDGVPVKLLFLVFSWFGSGVESLIT